MNCKHYEECSGKCFVWTEDRRKIEKDPEEYCISEDETNPDEMCICFER